MTTPTGLIGENIQQLIDRCTPVTLDEYMALWMNSWEREALLPHLSDEALIYVVELCIKHCSPVHPHRPAATYDEKIIGRLVPELLKRLKEGT